jgi:hypothetical protein
MIYLYFIIARLHYTTPNSPPSGNHGGIETVQHFVVKANKLRKYGITMGQILLSRFSVFLK